MENPLHKIDPSGITLASDGSLHYQDQALLNAVQVSPNVIPDLDNGGKCVNASCDNKSNGLACDNSSACVNASNLFGCVNGGDCQRGFNTGACTDVNCSLSCNVPC